MWQHLLSLLAAARRPLVVKDFETSGLSGAPPVEFAVLVWAPWEPPQEDVLTAAARMRTPPGLTYATSMRLDPLRPIDPGAQRVHGITDADVRGKATRWDDMEVRGFFRGYAEGDPPPLLLGDVTEAAWRSAGSPATWPASPASLCNCGQRQYMTPSGITCANGHGGETGTPCAEEPRIGPAIWCGHNAAASDVPWARRWGYLPEAEVDLIDTIRMARRLAAEHPYPLVVDIIPPVGDDAWTRAWGHPLVPCIEDGLDCYAGSLVGVHKAVCGARPEGSHGALADCEATARVLARMLDLWAPLFATPAADGKPPAEQLAALLAALDAPMPRDVSWDGWLADEPQEP